MKKSVLVALALVVLLGVVVAPPAEAQSNIRVTAITANPEPFKTGNSVAFSVTAKNTGAAATGAGTAYIDIFKADTWLAADQLFHAEQPVAALAAGASRTVAFATRWTVPAGHDRFWVRVVVVDPPNEFGEAKSVVFIASCSYARQRQLVAIPNLSVKQIRQQ
jgi:hypothetical protein